MYPARSDWVASILLIIACSTNPTPPPTSTQAASRDTTIVQRGPGDLEFSLTLAPIPRRVGDTMWVRVAVRNLGSAPVVVTVTPCYLTLAGVRTRPWPPDMDVCAAAYATQALAGGESWAFSEGYNLAGPPGRHPLRVQVARDPVVWLGTDLFLDRSKARQESRTEVEPLLRLYHSQWPGPAGRIREVVRDSARWSKLWAQVRQGEFTVEPPPAVDFSQNMVVVAALGTLASGGYDVVVDSVAATQSEYLVFVRTAEPGENCAVTGGLTQPVDVVRVNRSSLPVRFIEQTVVNRC